MSSPQPHRVRLRSLQFSLRGLLVMMTLVGVALTFYRWPWVVTKSDEVSITKTTYRRSWNGKPLRHGIETCDSPSAQMRQSRLYVDNEQRREELEVLDVKIRAVFHYDQGKRHGGSSIESPDGFERGDYRRDKKDGPWKEQYRHEGEVIDHDRTYAADLPHGNWTWKSSDGKLLQTARFDRGELLEWNDKPVKIALADWFSANQVGAIIKDVLQTRLEHVDKEHWSQLEGDTLEWPLLVSDHRLVLQGTNENYRHGYAGSSPSIFKTTHADAASQCVAEVVIANALRSNLTFGMRFGVVSLVRIADHELDWQDKTGVSQVAFAADSPQEVAWLEETKEEYLSFFDRDCQFQSLFFGTPIQIDATDFIYVIESPTSDASYGFGYALTTPPPPTHLRSRRDILGLILNRLKWSCEQRGNVLILHPYPGGP